MTIQNGNVPDLGGGLLNSGAHTRLINVVVRGNTAFHNAALSHGTATSQTAQCNAILSRATRLQ